MQNARSSQMIGWGTDARMEDRPGVPMEFVPPHPVGQPHWSEPEPQGVSRPSVMDRRRGLTPVYGTAVPLRGLSGLLRRLAYRRPTYRTGRWMTLMLADRVDVLEHTVGPVALLLGGVAALGVISYLGLRALSRR
jgi:hypothetical protein